MADDEVVCLVEDTDRKIPVTVITGFLGAGKSTLLTHLLTEAHGKRVAVIQNEIGMRTDIEEQQAKAPFLATIVENDRTEPEWLELDNGCLCCTVRDDFVAAVESLAKRRHQFDYVLIETDGLADPGKVASVFWLDDALESELYLDAVITLVDARNLLRCLTDDDAMFPEAQRQIAFADVVVLNKKDLVTEQQLQRVRDAVTGINGLARLLVTEYSRVDLGDILDVAAFDADKALRAAGPQQQHTCAADCAHAQHVVTVGVTAAGGVDLDRFEQWLGGLIWERQLGGEIFRVKGVVAVAGADVKYALQGVYDLFEVRPTAVRWEDGVERLSKLVFVGKSIVQADLAASFAQQVPSEATVK